MKPGTFIMDGVYSEDFKTYIQDRPLIDAPLRKSEFKTGYGVDGEVPIDEGAYHNTTLEMIMVTNGSDLIEDRQAFYDIIDTKGSYKEFIPYFDPDKIYRVMLNEKVSFENKYYYGNAQASSVKFTVKPYKYLIDSPEVVLSGKGSITNPTNYTSQPIMRIEGVGNVEIIVNDSSFKILDVPNKITIDSERFLAYTEGPTGPLESMNGKIASREYPLLRPGLNTIDFTGDISKIIIEPRWRSLV